MNESQKHYARQRQQPQKTTLFDFMYMKFQGLGERKIGIDCSWVWGVFGGRDKNALELDNSDNCTTSIIY